MCRIGDIAVGRVSRPGVAVSGQRRAGVVQPGWHPPDQLALDVLMNAGWLPLAVFAGVATPDAGSG
jgi:hypothetical protein